MTSKLNISLLGAPEFAIDGDLLKLSIRKNTALLAYLAVTGDCHSRESLVALLWPDHEPSYARAGLRRNLSVLKKSLGGQFLSIDRDTIGLDPTADIELDIERFRKLAMVNQEHNHPTGEICPSCLSAMKEAVEIYRGDFMEGFGLPDTPGFDDWQFFQCEGLRQEFSSLLESLVVGLQSRAEYKEAIPYARRWSQIDKLHEPAHRQLMNLYAGSNQRAAALRQYNELERLLKEELGVAPEPKTTELYETIKFKRAPTPVVEHASTRTETSADMLDERYLLEEELGRGGTGIVYRAHDILLDREVAVKVVPIETLSIEEGIRLLEEAQAAAKLNHPNIISVYDAGEAAGTSYIVMERGEGKSLHELKPDTLEGILNITRQICSALEYAHRHAIVHRDLKPENVILTGAGKVKLTDFGLARPVASRITSAGQIAGTVYYIAPEVALGLEYDGRADLYALGVMLYELTTGRLPFEAEDPLAVITQHIHAPARPPRARNADIPLALEALILRLLSKNPIDRPANAAEVIQILESPEILDREAEPEKEVSVLERIGRGSLVGREKELIEARNLWNRTLAGQGQLLLVSGEPGVGKTRLVREIMTQVQVSGGQVFSGACYAEGGVPYAPFAAILRSALDSHPFKGLDLPATTLADLTALAPTLKLQIPGIETGQRLDDPTSERHRLFESLVVTFAALCDKDPLLLVVEDIHWGDSGTLHLLRHLARNTRHQKIMIATTFRDIVPVEAEVFHEMLLDMRREELAVHMKLQRLDREQSGEMLGILFAEEITPEFLDGIYDETEGNPFYIEEVCKALVESGKLYYLDGGWHRPSVEELGIPQSVRTVIQSRVRVLPADTQDTLLLAAVFGREFDFDTLVFASGLNQDAVFEALEYSENAQLIEQVSRDGKKSYAFVHALIPTTLVETTRASKRRQLHRQAAEAVEQLNPEDYEVLAFHYQRAGEEGKAVDYLLKTGDRARGLYANQEAIHSYQKAIKILKKTGDYERTARTLMKLGLTYHNSFDYKAARQAYQAGFVFWRQMTDEKTKIHDHPPQSQHTLRITAVEPRSIGLGFSMEFPSHVMFDQLFSGLVELSPDLGVVPDIASSWEVLDGGRKYVFHLRKDVRWSDGVAVTAHDFEYTWERILSPTSRHTWKVFLKDIKNAAPYYRGDIDDAALLGVRALDKYTLAVELEGPTSYFPYLMAFLVGYPMPMHVVEEHGDDWVNLDNYVCNGPFRLVSWVKGESMALERNPAFHGRYMGNLQGVECSFLTDRPARSLEMYQQGELDICSGLPLTDLAGARQRFAGEYISGPWLSTDFIGFNTMKPPFNDKRVRRAFAMATDREMLSDLIIRGYAFPATGGLIPPGMPGHSPDISLPFDPEQARYLLSEAGFKDGQGFPVINCLARDDPGHDLACEYLQLQWLEILGVEINWSQIKWIDFYSLFSEDAPPLWMTGWYADYPDPDDVFRVNWWIGISGWQNESFFSLVEGAQRVIDQEQRLDMYKQADEILIEETPLLPLWYGRFHMLVKPWVKQLYTSPMRWWSWKDIIIEPH